MSMEFGGIVVALFGKLVFHLDIMVLVGVLMSITEMFYIATYPYLPQALKFEPTVEPRPDAAPSLPTASANKLPPMDLTNAVPSVTEHTTNLLKVPGGRVDDR